MKVLAFFFLFLLAYVTLTHALPHNVDELVVKERPLNDTLDGIVEAGEHLRVRRETTIQKIERQGHLINKFIEMGKKLSTSSNDKNPTSTLQNQISQETS